MIYIEMTGSPKNFGFKTKEKFLETLKPFGVEQTKLNSPYCTFLITDNLLSKTIKMRTAKSRGIQILTYGQLLTNFKTVLRSKKIQELKRKMENK